MRITLTTKEVAEQLCTSRNMVDTLRQEGAIIGIKKGNGYIFHYKEIERFVEEFTGLDMSNREAIRQSLNEIRRRKQHDR